MVSACCMHVWEKVHYIHDNNKIQNNYMNSVIPNMTLL
jgi:hypothetical protein